MDYAELVEKLTEAHALALKVEDEPGRKWRVVGAVAECINKVLDAEKARTTARS